MRHSGSIEINKPIILVTKLFADPNHLGKYQDGFIKKELISGKEGETGAVSRMYYKHGNREMLLTETIVANELPYTFEAFYHHKHMDNTMRCVFLELDENKTEYKYTFEYTRIDWIMPKLMSIIFPGMYKKHGDKWIRQFKEFVEAQ